MPASLPASQPASQPASKGRRMRSRTASGQESVGKTSVAAAGWLDWGGLSLPKTSAVATDT
jgi:hypothetical protein